MDKSDLGTYHPSCFLAHDLLNKLTVVLGNCDLLQEEAPEGSACLKRLLLIRDVASSMAEDLKKHQCHLSAVIRRDSNDSETAFVNASAD